jgi:NAD dependent epimerase/dehydratase family enzyme
MPFRLLAGGPMGDGAFWQSWIHLDDEIGLLELALADGRCSGPLDATSPEPVRNRDLARAMGRVLRRPSLFPTPALALRLALGDTADVILASQRVLPARALALGYRFRFPALEPALRDLLCPGT